MDVSILYLADLLYDLVSATLQGLICSFTMPFFPSLFDKNIAFTWVNCTQIWATAAANANPNNGPFCSPHTDSMLEFPQIYNVELRSVTSLWLWNVRHKPILFLLSFRMLLMNCCWGSWWDFLRLSLQEFTMQRCIFWNWFPLRLSLLYITVAYKSCTLEFKFHCDGFIN